MDNTKFNPPKESLRESEALLSQVNERLEERVQQQTTELKESQARYEDLYQNAPDMFISVDPENGCIVQCNQTLLTEMGYTQDEVVGHSITKLFHPSSLGVEKIVIPQFRAQGYVRDRELTLARKDGTPICVSMNTSAIRDNQGHIIASRSVFRDITEQKRLEEEARIHRDQLAHLSRVATMNEMATGIAHELNQPLHAIKNYAQGALIRLGKQSMDPALLAPVFEDIVADADRAAELILSLRRYVKPSEKHAAPVEPTVLVARVVKILAREFKQRGSTMSVVAAEALPAINCDAVQIEQVLINLMLNAVEAVSDAADREIVVHVEPSERETVRFAVVDQGVGISEDELDHIFDTFYTKKASGMGVGLAICRTIVEAHGGTLMAKANKGPGLTVSFQLPIAVD